MTVKVIPISPAYRANFDGIFGTTPGASGESCVSDVQAASENPGVFEALPPAPLIAPDSAGRASSAPRGATDDSAGKDSSPAGLISRPSEFDSPTRYQKDTVTLCGPAVWPFDNMGRVMDYTATDRDLLDTVAF